MLAIMKKSLLVMASLGSLFCVSPATAYSEGHGSYLIELRVPVICNLSYDGAAAASEGGGYRLGDLREYCNAPEGYAVTVNYAAGSMRGAVIEVGDDHVVLDGSGTTTISRAAGPRIRNRAIVAIPGPGGFDTDRLNFQIAVA